MSHFTVIKTEITDTESLANALGDIGFRTTEMYQVPQHLNGYLGDQRKQVAHIIIRPKYVGSASNDIGFLRGDDGTYTAIISEYDRVKHNQQWLDKLAQCYAYHVTISKLNEQGFVLITDERQKDGQIHLVLRRMT